MDGAEREARANAVVRAVYDAMPWLAFESAGGWGNGGRSAPCGCAGCGGERQVGSELGPRKESGGEQRWIRSTGATTSAERLTAWAAALTGPLGPVGESHRALMGVRSDGDIFGQQRDAASVPAPSQGDCECYYSMDCGGRLCETLFTDCVEFYVEDPDSPPYDPGMKPMDGHCASLPGPVVEDEADGSRRREGPLWWKAVSVLRMGDVSEGYSLVLRSFARVVKTGGVPDPLLLSVARELLSDPALPPRSWELVARAVLNLAVLFLGRASPQEGDPRTHSQGILFLPTVSAPLGTLAVSGPADGRYFIRILDALRTGGARVLRGEEGALAEELREVEWSGVEIRAFQRCQTPHPTDHGHRHPFSTAAACLVRESSAVFDWLREQLVAAHRSHGPSRPAVATDTVRGRLREHHERAGVVILPHQFTI